MVNQQKPATLTSVQAQSLSSTPITGLSTTQPTQLATGLTGGLVTAQMGNLATTQVPTASSAPVTVESRLTELENIVHTLATFSRASEQHGVVAWVKKIGARLKADVHKL